MIHVLAVLGVGDMRGGPPAIGSLANYFGERPLEIRLWDPSGELLDFMDRYARECFKWNSAEHNLITLTDFDECLEGAEAVIICANRGAPAATHSERDFGHLPSFDLSAEDSQSWVPLISEDQAVKKTYEILRMINREEYPFEMVNDYKQSPIVAWLNSL